MNLPLEGLNDGLVQIVEDSLEGGLLDKYYNVREEGRKGGREGERWVCTCTSNNGVDCIKGVRELLPSFQNH